MARTRVPRRSTRVPGDGGPSAAANAAASASESQAVIQTTISSAPRAKAATRSPSQPAAISAARSAGIDRRSRTPMTTSPSVSPITREKPARARLVVLATSIDVGSSRFLAR